MRAALSIISMLTVLVGFSQSPDDRITIRNLNPKYLEHLIKVKVNAIRREKELKPLVNDSILYVAAKDQSEWMVKNEKLSHDRRDDDEKETPQDRAEFYGAENYLVGENIAVTSLNKTLENEETGEPYVNTTYEDLANDFVRLWRDSPPHLENMIDPDYEVTGIAVGIDVEESEIYATQKFAEVMFRYSFKENKEFFSYSDWTAPEEITSFDQVSNERIAEKFAHGLSAPDDSINFCRDCNTAIDTNPYKDKLIPKGTKFEYYTPNVEMMYEILEHRSNGLAIEFVPYTSYDCGNEEYYIEPSRRNNQSLFNGRVTEPLLRKDLIKGFRRGKYKWFYRLKKKDYATHFETRLARIPDDIDGYYEANVVVIKRGKVCRIMHFSDVCGERMEELYDLPYATKLNSYLYSINPDIRTLEFEIPFEQGKYKYDYADIKPLIDSITSDAFTVVEANIKAYSSLEGSKEINIMLQEKRANSIIRAFEEEQRAQIKADVEASENWDLFYKQIRRSPELEDYRDLSKEEIKQKLSEPVEARRLEPWLSKQRKAVVSLKVREDVADDKVGRYLVGEFNRHLDSINAHIARYAGFTLDARARSDTMAGIQWYTYRLIKQGTLDSNYFNQLEVPLSPDYSRLIKDNLWYGIDIFGSGEGNPEWEKSFYRRLNKLDRIGISSFEIRFDVMNYLVRNWKERFPFRSGVPSDLKDMIEGLNGLASTDTQKAMVDSLMINYHVKAANYYHFTSPNHDDELMRFAMEWLHDRFIDDTIPQPDALKLGSYFTWGEQEDLANNILEPYALGDNPNPDLLALFAKLNYYHHKEFDDHSYHDWLINIYKIMPEKEWCGMFVGPCNISFQVFDYEPLRDFYCERCSTYRNYAERPEDWPDRSKN